MTMAFPFFSVQLKAQSFEVRREHCIWEQFKRGHYVMAFAVKIGSGISWEGAKRKCTDWKVRLATLEDPEGFKEARNMTGYY